MRLRLLKLISLGVLAFYGFAVASAAVANSVVDLANYYDQVYQIKVVSPKAGSKSSIGSGFQVDEDGLIVTNYHVISDFVLSPDSHQIFYRSSTGEEGELRLLRFDVINDLAVLQHPLPKPDHLSLADVTPEKGEVVYALGNPRDYGITLVQGPSNGFVQHSYNPQLLFSGSLNPGMSGGPAVNSEGEVVGVNVATAGSQLSFLIPTSELKKLLDRPQRLDTKVEQYRQEISAQIKYWQRPRLQELIDTTWQAAAFNDRDAFSEIRHDFQCWGDTNDEDKERTIATIDRFCRSGNYIYLGRSLDAGQVNYSFSSSIAKKLNPLQFAHQISPQMGADNRSDFENSTEYQCHVNFVDSPSGQVGINRVSTCIRAYKQFHGLFDSLLLVESMESNRQFVFHASIAAAEKDQIKALNRKFVEWVL